MTNWTTMNGRRPPKTANGHASMVFDQARGELLLVIPNDGVEVWRWTGSSWKRLLDGLLPQAPASRPLVAFGMGDTHIFVPGSGRMGSGKTGSGEMLVCRLSQPDQVRVFERPELEQWSYNHGMAGFDADSGRFLVHVTDYDAGMTYGFDGESLDKLVDGPALMSGCYDEANARLVGIDIEDTLHAFDGSVWTVLHTEHMPTSSDIGYDPQSGHIFRLVAHSDEGMHLCVFEGGGWQPTERGMRPLMASAVVGVDRSRGQIVSYGGQDFRKAADWSDETWASEGQDFHKTSSEADRVELGRHTTPVLFGGKLVAINHSTLAADALGPGGWEVLTDPVGDDDPELGALRHTRLYDLSVNFCAAKDSLIMLDDDGGLWASVNGGKWEAFAEPGQGPSGHYARRVSLDYDAVYRRLVVFGGVDTNTTWVFEDGAWRELDDELRPSHGVGSTASTPDGLYLVAGPDLWLLERDRWRCVGSDEDWLGRHLRYDPSRRILLSLDKDSPDGNKRRWRLGAWRAGKWREVGRLPEELHPSSTYSSSGAEVGVDPIGDRLVALGGSMFWALDLSECALPEDELPTDEVTPAQASRPAPDDALFDAVALVPISPKAGDAEPQDARELGLNLIIPRGWRLVATVPHHPVASALEGFGGLAVLMHPEWWKHDFEPWRLGGGGLEVVLLAEEPPLLLADPYDDDMMVPAEMHPFQELAPEHQTVYNTPTGAQLERAYGTKLGGRPRYIQGDVLEYYESDDHPQFVMQLRADVFDCLFGDFGAAYVFINENGEGKAVMQSH